MNRVQAILTWLREFARRKCRMLQLQVRIYFLNESIFKIEMDKARHFSQLEEAIDYRIAAQREFSSACERNKINVAILNSRLAQAEKELKCLTGK